MVEVVEGKRLGRKHPVTILVVDHDPTVLRLLRFLLVSAGYSVLEAHTDAEAIEKLTHSALPIDLLLVDVELPGQGRDELARHVRTQAPETCVLYMSSLSEYELARAGLWKAAIVHKPLGASALVRRIRELLPDQGR
jgi:DNA-binding response OmpR family regulator